MVAAGDEADWARVVGGVNWWSRQETLHNRIHWHSCLLFLFFLWFFFFSLLTILKLIKNEKGKKNSSWDFQFLIEKWKKKLVHFLCFHFLSFMVGIRWKFSVYKRDWVEYLQRIWPF